MRKKSKAPAKNTKVRPHSDFPVVCLGAAGGVRPYREVIRELPPDAGLAVVVVNHSKQSHTKLPEILAAESPMPVQVITAGLKLRPNRIYITPHSRDVAVRDGVFRLSPPSEENGWPAAFTAFLESLAREWKGRSIAAILSGLDSAGVNALRRIKAAGGITFARKVETAEHPGMAAKAMESGCVDYELTPSAIGRELARIAQEDQAPAKDEPAVPGAADFPIVGIGASAGGLEAFTSLLEHLPAHTGMAFVLVQHLDPTHESQLTDILSRKSAMPVREVQGDTPVEADHVYVMPPGHNLTISGGILQTVPRPETGGRNMPIDAFLQALAKDRQNAAFGIILSGTASDGTLGARSIKSEGGITFAQDPASARFDGMPRSAIASGAIDFVLPPEGIARQLMELFRHSYLRTGPGEIPDLVSTDGRDLDRIFIRLRAATGIDFTYYKHSTILRRIKRRMALHGVEDLQHFSRLVEQNSKEASVLAQDFLVNVTSFFREPEVHAAMRETIFPALLEGRSPDDAIRIWIPGCSTGEEAFSLAIGLTEYLEEHAIRPGIQIFATDLSDAVIDHARSGAYPESAVGGVSPERLERFFIKRGSIYQLAQSIRDLCVFARQDVTRDPPFSRMDLISCCNLLIYLRPVLQKKVLSMFHFALKRNGFLVLGSSESIGTLSDAFETIDRKHKIFARKETAARPHADLLAGISTGIGMTPAPGVPAEGAAPANSIQKEAERMLLAEYAPASVIVDEAMRVLQVRGQADPYLQVPQGAPTANLTLMVRPGLLAGLKAAVERARTHNAPASEKALQVKEDDHFRIVDLRVSPIRGSLGADRCFLVLFEDSEEHKARPEKQAKRRKAGRANDGALEVDRLEKEIARLEHELTETRDYLQSIIETQEASAEELRSSNEEAQATNEELDTAKEELQASNEELNTVNEELRIRNAEQSGLNNALRQLLENINVPLVMVGRDLRIRLFTAAMEPVLNLLPTDQGRAITDLRSTLIPDFAGMLVRTLSGKEEKAIEFQHPDGNWLSLRILPCRGPENRIEGVVATLIDIDDLKRALNFAEAVVATVREPLIVLGADLRVKTANAALYKAFGLAKEETVGRFIYDIGNGQWNIPGLRKVLEDILPERSTLTDFPVEHTFERLGAKTMLLNAREIYQQDGERMILLAIEDITGQRQAADDLRRTNEDLKQFIYAASHDLQEPLRMVVAHTQLLADRYAGQLDDKGAISIRYAVEGALRMEALISGLREFWQLSERDHGEPTPIDCGDVLRQVLLNLEAAIAESGGAITSGPLPSILAAEAPLIQLFQNLIGNALKYRTQEPPRIHVSAVRNGGEWIFSVRDNGIGIDPQHAVQIFGVFKRLHPRDKYSGTGIGLAICQKIVERYGGRIWVESELGRGAEFKFAIPS